MLDFNELNTKIQEINKQVSDINIERQQNIGKKDTLEAQLQERLKEYENHFGIKLEIEHLDEELQSVMAKKEQEFGLLEASINMIREGNFAGAEEKLNIVKEGKVEVPKDTVTNGEVVKQVIEEGKIDAPTVEAPTAEAVAASVVEAVAEPPKAEAPKAEPVAPPTTPVAPKEEVVAPPTAPSAPTEVVTPPPVVDTTKVEEETKAVSNAIPGQTPLTPPTSNPSSFGEIFGGTSFSL